MLLSLRHGLKELKGGLSGRQVNVADIGRGNQLLQMFYDKSLRRRNMLKYIRPLRMHTCARARTVPHHASEWSEL